MFILFMLTYILVTFVYYYLDINTTQKNKSIRQYKNFKYNYMTSIVLG